MKFPLDLVELNSHEVIFHNTMWVIWIVASDVKWVLLCQFYFDICLLDTPDLI